MVYLLSASKIPTVQYIGFFFKAKPNKQPTYKPYNSFTVGQKIALKWNVVFCFQRQLVN